MSTLAPHDTPPEWFNNGYIETALRRGLKQDDLEVVDMEIKMAAAAGDHYASRLFRCHLKIRDEKEDTGKTRDISVIVKALPMGSMGEELKKFGIFEKEAAVLDRILPRLTGILRRVYPDQQTPGPEAYYHEKAPNNIIIMEDLQVKKFKMANRMEGLDRDHARLVLRGLARYHAASLVLLQESPDDLTPFEEQVWSQKNSDLLQKFIGATLQALSDDFPNWGVVERRDVLQEKLNALRKNAIDGVIDLFVVDNSRVNVLLHGDCWVNNFMFRYDPATGRPADMKFVDFQLPAINSPTVDLQYFIFSSMRDDLRFTEVDALLRVYHDELSATLQRLQVGLEYGYEELKRDFDERYLWGLVIFCCISPLFKVPSEETMKPDDLLSGETDVFKNVFRREDVRRMMLNGFEYFEGKGAL